LVVGEEEQSLGPGWGEKACQKKPRTRTQGGELTEGIFFREGQKKKTQQKEEKEKEGEGGVSLGEETPSLRWTKVG